MPLCTLIHKLFKKNLFWYVSLLIQPMEKNHIVKYSTAFQKLSYRKHHVNMYIVFHMYENNYGVL